MTEPLPDTIDFSDSKEEPKEDSESPSELTAKQRERKAYFRAGRIALICSALTFFFSVIFNGIVQSGQLEEYPLNSDNVNQYRSLDPALIQEVWQYRRDLLFLNALIDLLFFVSFAYFYSGLSAYTRCFVWASPNMRLAMISCIGLASLFPALEFLQNLGTLGAGVFITDFETFRTQVPTEYYADLEVAYLILLGRSAFVFALSYLFLAAALVFSYLLNRKEQVISQLHGYLGLTTALICVVVFALAAAAGGTDAPSGREKLIESLFVFSIFLVICLLIWLIWLAVVIGKYTPPSDEEIERRKEQRGY